MTMRVQSPPWRNGCQRVGRLRTLNPEAGLYGPCPENRLPAWDRCPKTSTIGEQAVCWRISEPVDSAQLTQTSALTPIQTCTEGSNPSLSAMQAGLHRNSPEPYPEIRETCPFVAIIRRQTGLQRTDCPTAKVATALAFLRRTHAQPRFAEGTRRMHATTSRCGESLVDFQWPRAQNNTPQT
jgi:hypothetical protein